MAQEPLSKEAFLAKLEAWGLPRVKVMLANNKIGSVNDKKRIAQEWVLRSELERIDASDSEQMRVALSAKRAAWTAANTAIVAAIVTMIGTTIVIVLNWAEILAALSLR